MKLSARAWLLLGMGLAACGGRELPAALDNPTDWDAGSDDAPFRRDAIPIADRSNVCGGMQIRLSRRQADVLFLVDRSGSMNEATRDGSSKWNSLLRAFRDVLPRVQTDLTMGLVMFPRLLTTANPTPAEACTLAMRVDVTPSTNSANEILSALGRALPFGATPTWAALQAALAYWRANPDRTGQRYVVLATDGGPNCNGDFDNRTCRCSNANVAQCRSETNTYARYNCLDDARTVAAIRELGAIEVPTYVIGLAGTEEFSDVLNEMAIAGGRPRATAPRYFSVTTGEDLLREFTSITSGLIECNIRLDTSPPDPSLVDVRLGGDSLIHDTGHLDGWDWQSDEHREIRFYGTTCARVQASSGGTVLSAAFGCPAPTPP